MSEYFETESFADQMRQRAERAEALLNNIVSDDRPFTTPVGDCAFCDVYLDMDEVHDPDCPIARARALLAKAEP